MHEMGIAMQLMEIATASIPEGMVDAKIEKVNLRIGKLAAVVPDSLRFCFDIITKETSLSGAELHIEEVPVVAECETCDHRWTVEEPVFLCPQCQNGTVKLISGRELEIQSIEIEE